MIDTCYTDNCVKDCPTIDGITDEDMKNDRWCECVYHTSDVLLDLYDRNEDWELDKYEFQAMFNYTTDEFIGEWPHSLKKDFDSCDTNRDGKIDMAETEICYDKACVNDCATEAQVANRNDTWCECRTKSFEVVIDQFDDDLSGDLSMEEFDRIVDRDTDTDTVTVTIDFTTARFETSHSFVAATLAQPAECTEIKTECDAAGTCTDAEKVVDVAKCCDAGFKDSSDQELIRACSQETRYVFYENDNRGFRCFS